MYSGMHKAAGLSVQVACTPAGRLAGGHTQDGQSTAEALRRSGLFDVPTSDLPDEASLPQHIVDKGYIGLGMITPKKLRTPPSRRQGLRQDHQTMSATRSNDSSPTSST